MKPTQFAFVVFVPLALAACGVPDLVAHGVKSYEKSQERGPVQPAIAQPEPAKHSYQPVRYEPETQAEPVSGVPPRDTVVAEPLR